MRITRDVVNPKYRGFIWCGVILSALAINLSPVVHYLGKGDVSFRHFDSEAGVSCLYERSLAGSQFECFKDDLIGLNLSELDSKLKQHKYKTQSGDVLIERVRSGRAFVFTYKSDDEELSSKIQQKG
ncbi:TPA: hypothetical protein I7730_16310 [Vibrio vulnificus]|uniref:Uncharacterized protein n=1 Tax=Vibrio vulnificus TaxID=672 RepID=A0A8H9N210_VIBVL|nr:hypothetical protein [Vibrio vulnificus]